MPGMGGGAGGGLTVSGQTTSSTCSISSGICALDGTSNQVTRSLTYSATTGKFTGTVLSNLCSNNKFGRDENGTQFSTGVGHTASCVQQTFPAPAYTGTGPFAAPLRGPVAYSLYGVYIYGPFEAGFALGQACTNGKGSCDAGLDVNVCGKKLEYDCGSASLSRGMLMDSCGGHAGPYHYHTELKCDDVVNVKISTYGSRVTPGHSPLVGIALDGRGVYGKYESTGVVPTNLDVCGGHVGSVPTVSATGITGHTDEAVYHYHSQDKSPFMVGCFGPVATVDACKSLYASTCGTGTSTFTTAEGNVTYDTDCPCGDATAALSAATPPATSSAAGSAASPSSNIQTLQRSASATSLTAAALVATAVVGMSWHL